MKLYITFPALFKFHNLIDDESEENADGKYLREHLKNDPRWVSIWNIEDGTDKKKLRDILNRNKIKFDIKED